MICVDSSVAAKWFFFEDRSDLADALLRQAITSRERIVAPRLLLSEVTNIIRQRMRSEGLTLPAAQVHLARLHAVPISYPEPRSMYAEALSMAASYNLPATYDAHYVALARIVGATFWTDDQRLIRAVGNNLPFVRWIGDYA